MHGMHDLPDVPSGQSNVFAWLGFLWQGSVLGYAGQNLLPGMLAENPFGQTNSTLGVT